ncbi:MAG: hypothetical protein LIO46_02610 [Clostridiales bacterium]|nr:hypothetical protein [Clostridiales bacterium]
MFENIAETIRNAFSVFSTFKFTDVLDIFFVTLLIFGLIRIIRETRAIQLLKGIALLVVGYAVIRLIGMESSSYILNALFSDWLLILIILFSGEIRHALEQIGKASVS